MNLPLRALSVTSLAVCALLAGSLLSPAAAAPAPGDSLTQLTVNAQDAPFLVDGDPVFGWALDSDRRGVTQSSYRLRVVEADRGDVVWDSGRVASSQSSGIAYAGPDLQPETEYRWSVESWDQKNSRVGENTSTFRTGLRSSDGVTRWGGAEWLRQPKVEAARIDDRALSLGYTYGADFKIVDGDAGITFGGWDDDYTVIRVEDVDGTYRLRLYDADVRGLRTFSRENNDQPDANSPRGYKPVSVDVALAGFDPALTHRIDVVVAANMRPGAGFPGPITQPFSIRVDGVEVAKFTVPGYAGTIRARQLGLYTEGSAAYTNIRMDMTQPRAATGILNETTSSLAATPESSIFAGVAGATIDDGWITVVDAHVQEPTDGLGEPVFRKEFTAAKAVSEATLYATARGIYEFQINGEKVGDQIFAPGYTDFDQTILYQAYDVTDMLSSGPNVIGAELNDGWYSGSNAGLMKPYGAQPSIMGVLKITYEDGTTAEVPTDASWTYYDESPILESDFMHGENYDANRDAAFAGWSEPGYNASAWTPAAIESRPTGAVVIGNQEAAATVVETRAPISRTVDARGNIQFDFGENIVGNVRVKLTGPAGSTAELQYGEMLNDASLGSDGPPGTVYNINYRSAKVTDYYTFDESGEGTFAPKFTFHGFRYLEVSGFDGFDPNAVQLADVEADVISSVPRLAMEFESSSDDLNALHRATVRGMLGNFLSVPTDTPARDERSGWLGDAQVFAPTSAMVGDVQAFFHKWLTVDVVDTQVQGVYSYVAPQPAWKVGAGVPVPAASDAWSDGGVIVPYAMWKAYGDVRLLEANYDSMAAYVDRSLALPRSGFADHTAPTPSNGAMVLAAYQYRTTQMMTEIAAELGREDDATRFGDASDALKQAYLAKYFADGTGVLTGADIATQTGYSLALRFGLYPDGKEQVLTERLTALLTSTGGGQPALSTGFLGTPNILPALSERGRPDAAFDLLFSHARPTWLYTLDQGATTFWEHWNAYSKENGFRTASQNSFNHYSYGAVSEWIYNNVAGIRAATPGYAKTQFRPLVDDERRVTASRATLQTVYGPVTSDWSIEGDDFVYDIVVPANTTAEVHVPLLADNKAVWEGDGRAEDADGVKLLRIADGEAVYEVGSGAYAFRTSDAEEEPGLQISASVRPTSLGGKVFLSVVATNDDTLPVDLVITTPYGAKTFLRVAPGRTVSVSINSRLASIPAGTVSVDASGIRGGATIEETVSVPYAAYPSPR